MSCTRRQFLYGMSAAALASCSKRDSIDPASPLVEHFWSGIGFGIEMSAEVYGIHDGRIKDLKFEKLIQKLENAFSLYSDNSELSRLNDERVLVSPSPLFLELLLLSKGLSRRTLGYYQPAVHAAWTAMEEGELRAEHLAAADLRHLGTGENGDLRLNNPLTELSFNAIVQGYLADLAAERLRDLGVRHAMLHMGESYAIGAHPEGRPWNLAIMGTPGHEQEADIVGTMSFENAGLAVSTHEQKRKLLNPLTGVIEQTNRVVAVTSKEGAAVADAFATAFTVAPQSVWGELYKNLTETQGGQVKIWIENELAFEA